jgi:phage RecT family recombinase
MAKTFRKKDLIAQKQEGVIHSVEKNEIIPEIIKTEEVKEELSITAKSAFFDKLKLTREKFVILHNVLKEHSINSDAYIDNFYNEIINNKRIYECFVVNPSSVYSSLFFGAELGLMPSENAGEFFLFPKTIIENGQTKLIIVPTIGYKGFITLLYRTKQVKKIWSECVFSDDNFEYELGLEPKLVHKPIDVQKKQENITHVYACAKLENGETLFTVLTKKQIEALNDISTIKSSLYFNDKKDPNHWMIKKAAIKQLAKMIPKDFYIKKALDYDNRIETGGYVIIDEESKSTKVVDTKIKKDIGIYNTWA